jgi:hypothetical protein
MTYLAIAATAALIAVGCAMVDIGTVRRKGLSAVRGTIPLIVSAAIVSGVAAYMFAAGD